MTIIKRLTEEKGIINNLYKFINILNDNEIKIDSKDSHKIVFVLLKKKNLRFTIFILIEGNSYNLIFSVSMETQRLRTLIFCFLKYLQMIHII